MAEFIAQEKIEAIITQAALEVAKTVDPEKNKLMPVNRRTVFNQASENLIKAYDSSTLDKYRDDLLSSVNRRYSF